MDGAHDTAGIPQAFWDQSVNRPKSSMLVETRLTREYHVSGDKVVSVIHL